MNERIEELWDKAAEIVKILPTKVWSEKDFLGTVHIKIQHEGMPEFDFIQIQYDYNYTSNAHQEKMTKEILKLMGV